jgi:hypothetical protein
MKKTQRQDLQLLKVVRGDDRVLGLQATSAVHLSEDFFRKSFLAIKVEIEIEIGNRIRWIDFGKKGRAGRMVVELTSGTS